MLIVAKIGIVIACGALVVLALIICACHNDDQDGVR